MKILRQAVVRVGIVGAITVTQIGAAPQKEAYVTSWYLHAQRLVNSRFRSDSDNEARAIMPISAFRFGHHTPNSVAKKAPNNLENDTLRISLV